MPPVAKGRKATPAQPAQDKPKTTSAEVLIEQNGRLVEELYQSKVWVEIIKPLIDESIASVCGRFTNGRYWHGGLTTKWAANEPLFYAAYQKALMDFNNNLNDFVLAKEKLLAAKKAEKADKDAPIYNPFMEPDSEN